MKQSTLAGVVTIFCLLVNAPAAPGADDATLFRVFLKDGGTLVSYGEVARVGDRVVFSMPIGSTGTGAPPPLHLTSLAADRIDWPRTERYAMSARSGRYIETQAEIDYTELSNQVAQTLTEVGSTNDPARRLELVERARRTLAAWPPDHFNYREPDVRQLVTMLDAAIADLRASSGQSRQGQFAFNLVAFTSPPPLLEPLLPAPTLRESIEQVLLAARMSDSPADRVQLYKSALGELERRKGASDPLIPTEWVEATSATVTQAIATEGRVDRNYQTLTQRMLRIAGQRARLGDVRGLERLVTRVHTNDRILGSVRPDIVSSLLASIEEKLDAARRLQLARDRWALRAPVLAEYRLAIQAPLEQFAVLKSALEDIKSLAGTPPGTLKFIERAIVRVAAAANAIQPPDELVDAHALFVSAVSLAQNAASIRREATLASSLERAWDASSAAAGSLMLGAKARTDIQTLLRRPQLK
jgi:hypothetical protein